MKVCAVVPAAGRGLRMGKPLPKQFLNIKNVPVIVHTLRKLAECSQIDEIIVAVTPSMEEYVREEIIAAFNIPKIYKVISGGTRRQDSVLAALNELPHHTEIVLVHDGVRPFIQDATIKKAISEATLHGAAVVGIPAFDTPKLYNGVTISTLERKNVWLAQTPQVFRRELICMAYKAAYLENIDATDDSSLVERINHKVVMVEGSTENIKITTPFDLIIAEQILGCKNA